MCCISSHSHRFLVHSCRHDVLVALTLPMTHHVNATSANVSCARLRQASAPLLILVRSVSVPFVGTKPFWLKAISIQEDVISFASHPSLLVDPMGEISDGEGKTCCCAVIGMSMSRVARCRPEHDVKKTPTTQFIPSVFRHLLNMRRRSWCSIDSSEYVARPEHDVTLFTVSLRSFFFCSRSSSCCSTTGWVLQDVRYPLLSWTSEFKGYRRCYASVLDRIRPPSLHHGEIQGFSTVTGTVTPSV